MPGHVWVATDRSEVLLLDVRSADVVRCVHDPSWLRVLVSSSPETGELFVASVDRHEVSVLDFNGETQRRLGRDALGRLDWPSCVGRCGATGYAISNTRSRDILVLSPEFRYVGALLTPAWVSKRAYGADRLFAVIGGAEASCLTWEFQPVGNAVGV